MLVQVTTDGLVLLYGDNQSVIGYFSVERVKTRRGVIRLIRELVKEDGITVGHISEVLDVAHSLAGK